MELELEVVIELVDAAAETLDDRDDDEVVDDAIANSLE